MNLKHGEIVAKTWNQCFDCKTYVPYESMDYHTETHCLWKLRSNKRKQISFPIGKVCFYYLLFIPPLGGQIRFDLIGS